MLKWETGLRLEGEDSMVLMTHSWVKIFILAMEAEEALPKEVDRAAIDLLPSQQALVLH